MNVALQNAPRELIAQQGALLRCLLAPSQAEAMSALAASTALPKNPSIFNTQNPALLARGLQAYRANAGELAVRCLQAAYPIIAQLIGTQTLEHLARDLWRAHPPQRGDLAHWGRDLAGFFSTPALMPMFSEHPYLADMARMEWALHSAATAADGALDAVSFALLTQHEPEQLQLCASAGAFLLPSAYPLVAIAQLHSSRAALYEADDASAAAIEQARLQVRQGIAQTVLIWRRGLRPMLRAVAQPEQALIASLLRGENLADVVNTLPVQDESNNANLTPLDFSAWLAARVQDGLLIGARLKP